MAETERLTITLRKGVREMLAEEFPHQSISATVQLLVEMAIDAELVCSKSKLEHFAALRSAQTATPPKPPKIFIHPDVITIEEEESFGE